MRHRGGQRRRAGEISQWHFHRAAWFAAGHTDYDKPAQHPELRMASDAPPGRSEQKARRGLLRAGEVRVVPAMGYHEKSGARVVVLDYPETNPNRLTSPSVLHRSMRKSEPLAVTIASASASLAAWRSRTWIMRPSVCRVMARYDRTEQCPSSIFLSV